MSRPRAVLEAVVFDAGGTLVRLDFEWMAEIVSAHGTPVDTAAMRRAEVEGRRRYDSSRRSGNDESAPLGRSGDVRAYFGGTLAAVGVPDADIEELVDAFLTRERSRGLWSRPVEGARDALDAVARLGLRCAVVSNSDGRAEWHLKYSQVHEGVEFVVDSLLVGVEKPDPAIFHIALKRLGVAPERALYVGDIRSVDERGAHAAGMHFVLIDPWCDYGEPGGASVRAIADLPSWITTHFEVPRAATAQRDVGGG